MVVKTLTGPLSPYLLKSFYFHFFPAHLYITSYISGVNNPQWASAYHVHYQEGTVEMSYERECVDENGKHMSS